MAEEQAPTEEQLRRLEEEIRRLKVSDFLVQTVYTVSSLGYGKLAPEGRDLEQAQLAIETLRVLVPVLEGAVPADLVRDLNQVRANMQLAYAKAVADAGQGAEQQATTSDNDGGTTAGTDDGESGDEPS